MKPNVQCCHKSSESVHNKIEKAVFFMRKHLLVLLLVLGCLLLTSALGEAVPSVTGPLKVTGTQLTDLSGEPVQLRGISTHGLSWFPQYVNEDTFRTLKNDFGCNVVRLAMYTG